MKRFSAIVLLAVVAASSAPSGQAPAGHFTGTWKTALIGRPAYPPVDPAAPPANPQARVAFPNNQTLRQVVHTTIGTGVQVRIVVSNVFGTAPLTIGAAHLGRRDKESSIVAGSDQRLTFSGRDSATIPAGATMVSDPSDPGVQGVAPMSDLVVDLFIPNDTVGQTLTIHRSAMQTSYVTAGNHAGETTWADATRITTWYFLERVEVTSTVGAVVTLGDSITDGTGSTVDANRRWPDVLAQRLAASASQRRAVLNAGIAGNRLLTEQQPEFGINILARFDRDVLLQPGVSHVVVLEGINDIGMARDAPSPTAEDLIAAYQQMIVRAHSGGLRIIGATLTPFEGAAYYTEVGEAKRSAVNKWIRTSKGYDGVVDFDEVVRDPDNPKRLRLAYDRGDHLHPNDAGYDAMGKAIDLALFR